MDPSSCSLSSMLRTVQRYESKLPCCATFKARQALWNCVIHGSPINTSGLWLNRVCCRSSSKHELLLVSAWAAGNEES